MNYIRLIVLFTVMYVILMESVNVFTVSVGIISGVIAIFLTNKILEIDYVEMFHVNIWLILAYFWIIIRDNYIAGFDVIKRVFTGDVKPNFIDYRSQLNDEFLIVLLVNAVTMPPGSIVVDRDGEDMTILTIGYEAEDFRKTTYNQIERLLKGFD